MTSEQVRPKGFSLDGLMFVLQAGVEGKTYKDEWHLQRVRENLAGQEDLWVGNTDFVFSDSVQKYRPSCRANRMR